MPPTVPAPVAPAAQTADPDRFLTLYGPMWAECGMTFPTAAVTLLLALEGRGFACYVPEPGKLMITPPHDVDGQPGSLTLEDREQIKRYKAALIELVEACKVDFLKPEKSLTK